MHFCPDVPLVLVGTKVDLRKEEAVVEKLKASGQQPISTAQGQDLSKKIKAFKYLECSARTQENLKTVFDEAIKAALFIKRKKTRCVIC